MNGGPRGRCVEVTTYLGSGGFPEEAADLREGWIGPTTIPEVERGGRVREPKRFLDRRPSEFRVGVGGVEDVSAPGWVVDRDIERRTREDAGRRDGGGPPLSLMDYDFRGAEGAEALSRRDR